MENDIICFVHLVNYDILGRKMKIVSCEYQEREINRDRRRETQRERERGRDRERERYREREGQRQRERETIILRTK